VTDFLKLKHDGYRPQIFVSAMVGWSKRYPLIAEAAARAARGYSATRAPSSAGATPLIPRVISSAKIMDLIGSLK
jgi:hypothetical protein